MSVDEQRAWFEAWCISEGINAERSPVTSVYSYPSARVAWRAWKAAEAAAIERCAELIDGMNDSAGDRASYDNREMHEGEVERMNALSDAATAIRALLPKEES